MENIWSLIGSFEFPNQNLRQIGQEVHELWSDIQTNKQFPNKEHSYTLYTCIKAVGNWAFIINDNSLCLMLIWTLIFNFFMKNVCFHRANLKIFFFHPNKESFRNPNLRKDFRKMEIFFPNNKKFLALLIYFFLDKLYFYCLIIIYLLDIDFLQT